MNVDDDDILFDLFMLLVGWSFTMAVVMGAGGGCGCSIRVCVCLICLCSMVLCNITENI